MRIGDLARQDQLDAGKERIGDARLARLAGIFQHEHAALGLLGGDDVAGLEHQLFDFGEFPQRRLHLGLRLGRHQVLEHLPQRRQVVLRNLVVIGLTRAGDVVLVAGLRGVDRERHWAPP